VDVSYYLCICITNTLTQTDIVPPTRGGSPCQLWQGYDAAGASQPLRTYRIRIFKSAIRQRSAPRANCISKSIRGVGLPQSLSCPCHSPGAISRPKTTMAKPPSMHVITIGRVRRSNNPCYSTAVDFAASRRTVGLHAYLVPTRHRTSLSGRPPPLVKDVARCWGSIPQRRNKPTELLCVSTYPVRRTCYAQTRLIPIHNFWWETSGGKLPLSSLIIRSICNLIG
jgi:hypothetical protein